MVRTLTGRALQVLPETLQEHVRRLVRYGAVSIISSTVGLAVLGVLVGIVNAPAGWSNVVSTTVAAVPSFELNRRWSWQGRSGRAQASQAVPFFIMTFIGLGISTYVVHWAGIVATEHNLPRGHRTVAIESASLLTWGALWLVQYLILDRWLFKPMAEAIVHHHPEAELLDLVEPPERDEELSPADA